MTKNTSAIIIELDCLLDTRLTTLLEYYGADVVERVLAKNYHKRWVDKFLDIDYQEFQNHYQNRDKRVLKSAIRTPLTRLVQEFVLGTIANSTNTPFHNQPKVIVNIYPYELTESEIRVIRDTIITLTKSNADVEIISKSPAELTPRYLSTETSLMVMYDIQLWLEAHSENGNFKKQACPDMGLFTPMMFKKYPISNEDKKIIKSMDAPLFEYLAKSIAPFAKVLFLPVEKFSVCIKPDTD